MSELTGASVPQVLGEALLRTSARPSLAFAGAVGRPWSWGVVRQRPQREQMLLWEADFSGPDLTCSSPLFPLTGV